VNKPELTHTCFRVYNSGNQSEPLTLTPTEMKEWSEYNQTWRFGCAQFVDGQCVYLGYLKPDQIEAVQAKYKVT
jgi:hypothetical protein